MNIEDYIRFASALILVLALMGLLALLFKRLNGSSGGFLSKTDRLSIVEQKMIDTKTKTVLIRRDEVEHLVIVSHNAIETVETGIKPPVTLTPPKNKKDIPLEI